MHVMVNAVDNQMGCGGVKEAFNNTKGQNWGVGLALACRGELGITYLLLDWAWLMDITGCADQASF